MALNIVYAQSVNESVRSWGLFEAMIASHVKLGRYEDAIASYEKALEIEPNDDQAWNNRGIALGEIGCNEEAIASYDKALNINPNDKNKIYNKACCYSLWGKPDLALENLVKAINFDSKYQEFAKTDSDFDPLRNDPRFQALLNQ